MSDLKIDESTGMPEVPKGMFWRVREREDDKYSFFMGRTAKVYVELVQKATVTTIRKQSVWDIVSFQKPVLDKLEVTNVVESCGVFTVNVTTLTKTGAYGPMSEEPAQYYRYYATHELTPELILETATKVLERYRRKEAGNKLLGDYPPKSIISEETN